MTMTVVWIVVTIAAVIVEIATQALVSTWFAVGGFAAFVLAWCGVDLSLQMAAFLGVSAFSFFFIRRYLIPYTQVKITPTNLDRLIGQEAVVTREMPPRGRGEVKVNEQFWTARSDDPEQAVPVSCNVVIRAIEGATLIVTPIDEEL